MQGTVRWDAAGGCRKHIFWTTRVKSIEIYIFGILVSRAIDWYIYIWVQSGGGVIRGGPELFGPPLQKFRVTPTKF
jgi:hypothetical protein